MTPAQAVADLERIDRLLESGDGLTTAMNHDEGAPPDEWRFRVYRRGEPAALSDLLPLLGHLGLVALDERPSTFVIGEEQVHLYDIGVRVPPGTDVGVRQDEIRSTFEALMAGEVEADGFNRLVSLAGLTARQVSVLRAYAKYLRQIGFAFSQGYIEVTLSGSRTWRRVWSNCSSRSSNRASTTVRRRESWHVAGWRSTSMRSSCSTTIASAGPS